MKRIVRKILCGVLSIMLVMTAVPQAALADNNGITPQRTTEAITKFSDAMTKFVTDTSQMSKLAGFMTRFGGFTNVASGVVGILQMAGVIQDPTMAKLGEILDTVRSIEDQLKNMDKKLDGINQQLISIAVKDEEKDRSNRATQRLKDWQNFVSKYCEPLKDATNEYTGKVNAGIKAWWSQASHNGVYLLYTKTNSGIELTYKKQAYQKGAMPTAADNGEAVIANESFAVLGTQLPNTAKMNFNINTYRKDFVAKMAAEIVALANGKKLEGANSAFYAAWNKLSAADRNKKAQQYANDTLNVIIYQISCDVMSKNNDWVVGVKNKYENYCNNILQQDSGVNARLQAMYLTHGFEGEIKKDIEDFCDGMVAQAGLYGQFALTCAGQSDLQSVADIQKIQKQFADTVLSLADKKAQAITGHDNYCYVTNTVMGQDQVRATSSITATTESVGSGFALRGHESTDWDVTVPSILDDVYSQVLYHQYQSLNQGAHSFPEYLNKYGAFNDKDYTGTIMTKYVGAETFPLDDGIEMKASNYFAGESYFSSGGKYRIDVGTGSKVERDYYYVHDRVMVDLMDMGTGEIKVNQMAGARAFYGEAHGRWITDEPWMFYTEGIYEGTSTSYNGGKTVSKARFAIQLPVLKLTPVHDLNGDDDSGNPFFAFDRTMFIYGISNHVGPIIQNDRTHITSVKLSKTKFKYTGKAIKPKLTVKAGKKTVSAKNYTVKYLDNKAVGTATVVVTGKGKYAGMLSKNFSIVSKSGKAVKANTESKMVSKGKNAMTISWPAVKKADGYDVFFARCNHDGKKNKYKKVKTINSDKKHSYTKKGLKSGVSYKAKVRAFVKKKGKKKYIMTSPTLHAYSGNGTKNFTNAKSVKVNKTNVTLKKGKTYKIKATVTKQNKNKKLMPSSHMKKLRYRSMNKKIATVTKAGKIKAKAKGKCIIYVYAHNGVGKLVHVTVK